MLTPKVSLLLLASGAIWIAAISTTFVLLTGRMPHVGWTVAAVLAIALLGWAAVLVRAVNNAPHMQDGEPEWTESDATPRSARRPRVPKEEVVSARSQQPAAAATAPKPVRPEDN